MADKRSFSPPVIPQQPIDRFVQPIARFLHVEASAGVVLLICTLIALGMANSPWSEAYLDFWKTKVDLAFGDFHFQHSLKHLVNDGLMVVFFFVIGLEVKREIVLGELRDVRKAVLPLAAALGGMVVPAGIYLALQWNQPGMRGWGIPMATDIAFVVGCLAILGSRVPHGLRILLLSLAIADDIGAILVIAFGYTEQLDWYWLGVGLLGIVITSALARLGVRRFPVYIVVGLVIWLAFHESGVHATIAGVILGMMTPARTYLSNTVIGEFLRQTGRVFEGDTWEAEKHRTEQVRRVQQLARESISPLEYLEKTLHPWTGFVVMPIFALANAGVPIQLADLTHPVAIAVLLGLFLGKPIGIMLLSALAVKSGLARLPQGVNWLVMLGAGGLAGIGFTMALFIASLALGDDLLDVSKIGVLAGSAASTVFGMGLLLFCLPKPKPE